jgi:hypothetical protein
MTLHTLGHAPWRIVAATATWHVSSQQHARRNALVASTALAERRRELRDVEEFLAAHADNRDGRTSGDDRGRRTDETLVATHSA